MSEKEIPYDNTTEKECPICHQIYTQYPALSRRDNKTYICPDCGVREALEDYMKAEKKNIEEATMIALSECEDNKSYVAHLNESVSWDYYDKFEDLINKYMPDQGEGETFASQIVTAVNKLIYKWYNDGDVFDNVNSGLQGWANDLSSYANWLYKYAPGDAPTILKNIYGMGEESDYETLLQELADCLLDENLLSALEKKTQGSIYDCDGPFEFREYYEDEDEEDYYEDEEDLDEDDDELDESKKLNESVNNLTIRTGLTDKNAYDVLSSVVGQLSDGIWENSPGMSRYWQHMDIDQEGNEVVAKFDTQDYDSGFRGKDESQIKKWLANKVKQIVKEEGLDWNRDNTETVSYMHGSVTVQDAYRVYDKLLGRKDYIPDPNKKEESKEVMKKELNKDELLNKLEDYVLNQYTIFNDKLYDDFGDIQLNDKDNSKRSIYIYYDIEEDKISVTVGAAGARTFVDTLDEVAQFINAEIAKVNAQDEEVKKLTTESETIDYDYILKQIEFLQNQDSHILSIPDDFDALENVNIPEDDKYWTILDKILKDEEKSKGVYYSIDEILEELHEYIESKIKPVEESLDKDHDEYLKRMDKQYKTFCKNLELDEKDPDDALSALDELEGQFGDEDGEYQELREFIHNELLESKKITENTEYWEKTIGFNPYDVNYEKNKKALDVINKFKKAHKLDSLFDYLASGITEPFTTESSYLAYVADTDISDYEIYNGKLEEGTKQKRISHYNEFDNGYVLHSWNEMSNEEAEEKAKQASIDNPNDVYYVQYDDVMNPCSELRWFRGKQYTIDTIDKEDSEYYDYRNSKTLKEEGKKITDQDIRKAIRAQIKDNNGLFTDDSKYDVIERLTGIEDIAEQPEGLWERVDKIYETEFNK